MTSRIPLRGALVGLALAAVSSAVSAAGRPADHPRPTARGRGFHGASPGAAKAAVDTFLLMGPAGSGAPYAGDFEDAAKSLGAGANGWTSVDVTRSTVSHWHVDTYRAVSGARSAYCGDATYPACGPTDVEGGYGNYWDDLLEFRGTVTDPGLPTTVRVQALANIDTEAVWDLVRLQVDKAGAGLVDVAVWDDRQPGLVIDETVTYQPGEYVGAGADEIAVVWHFTSDGGWSDQDCQAWTSGAIQLDDVEITSDNGAGTGGVVDFEDGDLAPFTLRYPRSVGDFAKVWSYLEDADPCATNYSRQVAFIDDGVVVPGTGGSPCLTWCYGPGGYVVNSTGGLLGPDDHLHNAIVSPVMAWPDPSHEGALLGFDKYQHERFDFDSPGMFVTWGVRSIAGGDPAALEQAPWESRNFLYFSDAAYERQQEVVDDLIAPGATHVQVQLAVIEFGWVWSVEGNDGTPAPYFDNVRFETYPTAGPSLYLSATSLPQDAFPENGGLDVGDPASLWVRFDTARNVAPSSHLRIDRGDSLVVDVQPTKVDHVVEDPPLLHYAVRTNPVFDPYRTGGSPYAGALPGVPLPAPGVDFPNLFALDLPDTGWLFPGDVVHIFVTATQRDTVGGQVELSSLPADTTGFGDFDDPLAYPAEFTMRALPTLASLTAGDQPPWLFWNDAGADRETRVRWHEAFRANGMEPGRDVDIYLTQEPYDWQGNGLGAAAGVDQLAGYDVLLYTSGDQPAGALGNGDFAGNADPSPDRQRLAAWLDLGGKGAFLSGDALATDLVASGGAAFLDAYLGVTLQEPDVAPLIGAQMAPRVLTVPNMGVFGSLDRWIAYGGCPRLRPYDAVTASASGLRLAVFADAGGGDGGYPYSAATIATGVGAAATSQVISLPYGFATVRTDPDEGAKAAAGASARARLLADVMLSFGWFWPTPSGAPDAVETLAVAARPNPFNPRVVLRCRVGRPGRLQVKVYDLKGRLVRTLADRPVAGDTDLVWEGRDERERAVASGVYFYEARLHGEVTVGKLALVR